MEERIIAMRKELLDYGSEAGAETIHWHLEEGGFAPPSVATIYRTLKRRGFITPEPRKRPRASFIRFEASLPNECWQSDMTHWHFSDGTEIEILTFIDDYSRRVLACDVFWTVKGNDVRRVFARTCDVYGTPASVLTDGAIYNARAPNGPRHRHGLGRIGCHAIPPNGSGGPWCSPHRVDHRERTEHCRRFGRHWLGDEPSPCRPHLDLGTTGGWRYHLLVGPWIILANCSRIQSAVRAALGLRGGRHLGHSPVGSRRCEHAGATHRVEQDVLGAPSRGTRNDDLSVSLLLAKRSPNRGDARRT